MNEFKVKEYSKYYLKSLSKYSFKKEVNSPSSERVRRFLPLYCAINKSYGLINDPSLLELVPNYLRMLNGRIPPNNSYKKFIKSMESHYLLKDKETITNRITTKELLSLIKKYEISSYRLIKHYRINAKIANEIINGKEISMSVLKKVDLLNKLKRDYHATEK